MDLDEDLLLYESAYAPVLLELMADPACPKGNLASGILWDFSRLKVLAKQKDEILALERAWTQVQFNPAPRVRAWVDYFSGSCFVWLMAHPRITLTSILVRLKWAARA